ncbi:S8 family peptidase [Aquabacterium sp.]|uniref:S8 family peptidase n=1 Tax=Aquabacterium sp. TaxID=1872578 RepID=UPI0024897781|nr:S8 family peptidase [Aquabacterium sp.]MDI1259209.1 S8 family peptidase [Aquabacterium sp.]
MTEPLDHLLVAGYKESQDFKSTLSVRKSPPPQRERQTHGQKLLTQLANLTAEAQSLAKRRAELQLPASSGMTIAIEVSPPGAIDYSKQLEWKRDGIEVLSVADAGGTEIVALHVPEGSLAAFETRVRDYLTKDVQARKPGQPDKPKNAALVNAIESFRKAAFDELWTDDVIAPPKADLLEWVQIWLRFSTGTPRALRDAFAESATRFGIEIEQGYVSFPGRIVVAARSTRASLEQALELLDLVAEIRGVAPTAEFYLSNLRPHEQAEWIQDLHARSTYAPAEDAAYITLLDTGVNQGHPLLASLLDQADLHAVEDHWGSTDHAGHGTEMAGLASHGDLTSPLASSALNLIPHRLESVKILPPTGQNAAHLYGWVTTQAVSKVEEIQPDRRRTFAMMTTSIGATAGLPTEWSAAIDGLAFGLNAATSYFHGASLPEQHEQLLTRRLVILAAGNVPWQHWTNYPAQNDLSPVENPGQAWNALTVGACTSMITIDQAKWPSLAAIGRTGLLSPASTTSLLWRRTWPFKPDVVAEGGNGSLDSRMAASVTVGPESLRLLTTSHDITKTLLAETGDTSAAAAEVARVCGHLQARYPDYWPETVRALVIHGARFTPQMRAHLPLVPLKAHKEALLRRYGYGRVELESSLNSTRQQPTLVLQETIAPYTKEDGSIKLKELNMHELPWPQTQLLEAGGASVALRVTLSYFVEPNPSHRGWQSKFRYQSHGLRFAVKGSIETEDRFRQRINKLEREELEPDEQESMSDPDREHWFLGSQLRARGSVHSDVWIGNAAQLAAKSHIAIFPVGGWWKDWKESQRQSVTVRYSLVVTLEILEDVDVDLYTPIANLIGIPIPVST